MDGRSVTGWLKKTVAGTSLCTPTISVTNIEATFSFYQSKLAVAIYQAACRYDVYTLPSSKVAFCLPEDPQSPELCVLFWSSVV